MEANVKWFSVASPERNPTNTTNVKFPLTGLLGIFLYVSHCTVAPNFANTAQVPAMAAATRIGNMATRIGNMAPETRIGVTDVLVSGLDEEHVVARPEELEAFMDQWGDLLTAADAYTSESLPSLPVLKSLWSARARTSR